MRKLLLLLMIEHQIEHGSHKKALEEFKETIKNDELMGDVVDITDFPNHLYTVQQIKWMKHLLNHNMFF